MNEQVFTIFISIIGLLLTIIGFFCSFLLYLIFGKQSSTEEKLVTALSKIEGLEQAKQSHDNLFNLIFDRISNICSKEDCPYLQDRRLT